MTSPVDDPRCAKAAALLRFAALAVLFWASGAHVAAAADAPRWFDGARPSDQAMVALGLLEDAASHGLEPRDYHVRPLRASLQAAAQGLASDDARARIDQALTDAMQRYLSDLHQGRVDPRRIHHDYTPARREPFDAAQLLRDAFAARRLPDAVRTAAPPLAQYQRLREALTQLRALEGHAAWRDALPNLPRPARGQTMSKLEPGQSWSGVPLLAQRLAAFGDLRVAAPASPLYDATLADAVRAFQLRHGLAGDGVIGRATLAALQVSPSARARQIELTLERLRWTPLTQAPRMVVINIPEFVLRAYEVRDGRIEVKQVMKIIVGRAAETRTPVFDEDMRHIEFAPYWNVPYSIARGEVVPRLRRDPAYWTREGFEFVDGAGQPQTGLSAARLDAVLAGQLRIRQRPGPRNALGDIKFVFPNREHIYLHHTPSVGLFERDRRDFSHGCIRVEQPVALAAFVLQGMSGWNEQRVREAMAGAKTFTLRLAEPVPVLIAYATALVRDGTMHFFDDIYRLDRSLDTALREHSRQRETAALP